MKNYKIILSVLLFLVTVGPAAASFTMQPSSENLSMKFVIETGHSAQGKMLVVNTSEDSKILRFGSVDNIITKDTGISVPGSEEKNKNTIGLWTTFGDSEQKTFEANEQKEIPFYIEIPGITPPGIYAGSLTIVESRISREGTSKAGGVSMVSRFAYPFVVEVPGEKTTDYEITEHKFTDDHLQITIENKGNTAIKGTIISNMKDFTGLYNTDLKDDFVLYKGDSATKTLHPQNKPLLGYFDINTSITFYQIDITNNENKILETINLNTTYAKIPLLVYGILLVLIIAVSLLLKKKINKSKNIS